MVSGHIYQANGERRRWQRDPKEPVFCGNCDKDCVEQNQKGAKLMANYNETQSHGTGRQGNRGGWDTAALPEGYLQGGYYSDPEKAKLKKEYIVEYPKALANAFELDGGRDTNKRSQIRKFYEYLLRVDRQMRLQDNNFSLIEANLAELLPHVTYAGKRRVVSNLFIKFIEANLAAVHDEKDMRAFVKHFEAVVAFTKKD